MKCFAQSDLNALEGLYRMNLINGLSGFKSANLIGTIDWDGNENVAIFSSVIHLASDPPILGFIHRPIKMGGNTYENIKQTGFYTINHLSKKIMEDGHHTSATYEKDVSEFEMTNLKSEYLNDFKAPFVMQSPVKIAMKYLEEYSIKPNDTILMVGEIIAVYLEDGLLQEDGFIDLSKGNVMTVNGPDGYARTKLDNRYPYQFPKSKR
ncbi:flavin reductase [Muricauda sp. CAU 1633]|uniref:flavin reductase family protein n=1 Tax=Allomuricauda sp. CAU 1633 TaxID=2816036 RepID=UPI001A8C570E|nr:flavin reductase [Muricauda sp. CAU 1633]MBO0323617.1 flavin reductase [Muricauda sp. CAU 1633]